MNGVSKSILKARRAKPNIVVIGGSFVGSKAAELVAAEMYKTHRTILIERNTHFNNLFAFPRYAVVPKHEHRAFLPYTTMFAHLPPGAVSVHRGRATEIHADRVLLEGGESIPYEYLVIATGTRLTPPGSMLTDTKPEGIAYFQAHQQAVEKAQKIVIIGGGANGVQLATDIKDFYPTKSVTIVHPRAKLMHAFHPALHDIVSARCAELGIDVVLNERARIPSGGFPTDGSTFNVELTSGTQIPTDLAIMATGQTPNSGALRSLAPGAITPAGYISVRRTLQIADAAHPRVFALGDVADTTHAKAARPAMLQAEAVAANVRRLAKGEGAPLVEYADQPRGIHLSLGIKRSVKFQDPVKGEKPWIKMGEDGTPDHGADKMWKRKAPGIKDYYL